MVWHGALLCGCLGFLVCWRLIPSIQRRTMALAEAGGRRCFHHTHQRPVSRFGGIGLACAFVAVALGAALLSLGSGKFRTNLVVVLGPLAMFGLGVWDDYRPLGAKVKLLVQTLVSVMVYFCGLQIQLVKLPFSNAIISLGPWGLVATVFWLVTLTNLINLIDGIDGLAGGVVLMLMCLLAYVGLQMHSFSTLIAVGMAGALLGFLYYNFPPAKIYMGDGGAYLLGFLIGVLSLATAHKGTVAAALIAPLFGLALPIIDVTLAILRRGLKGLPIFRPDRKHIHHRLVEMGFSRRRTVLMLYGLSLLGVLMAFGVFWSQGKLVPILFGVMFLVIIVSARSFGLVDDWFGLRKVLGSSLQLRKETRYALSMSSWLQMEAERCESLQELWTSYLFLTRKLGFSQVRLVLEGASPLSQPKPAESDTAFRRRNRQELALANISAIDFLGEESKLSPELFEHLTELAAEAWVKAAQRWQSINNLPIRFEPFRLGFSPNLSPGRVMVSNPA